MSYEIQVIVGGEVHEVGFVAGADSPNPLDRQESAMVAMMVRDWADSYGGPEQ
uniref:hypothetical protein n=1 Tax=Amycolatopsis sp. CA-096443 TaxID=3239919 RepID=UPI003F4910B1